MGRPSFRLKFPPSDFSWVRVSMLHFFMLLGEYTRGCFLHQLCLSYRYGRPVVLMRTVAHFLAEAEVSPWHGWWEYEVHFGRGYFHVKLHYAGDETRLKHMYFPAEVFALAWRGIGFAQLEDRTQWLLV